MTMTYEYESNGACPFCGLRGCGHDRTKYQGPFGIAPKVSAAAPLPAALFEVARPSADETGALETSVGELIATYPSADVRRSDVASPAVGYTGETAPISAYEEPVEPPTTVVPITPHVGVERVLQVIEKRSKRKKAEQGSLF
jgi:hypothetical protein